MRHDDIELRGTFRYANSNVLDRALAQARRLIDEEELADLDASWIEVFTRQGATLRVNTRLPLAADRYLTAAVLEALASLAIDGVVETSHGGRCLDWFPAQAS
jgi:hypothetical protein